MVMNEAAISALDEALSNAKPPVRTYETASKRLNRCVQSWCPKWGEGGCGHYERDVWLEILIRPGKECEFWLEL
jgi:hypothetical protein